MSVERLQVLQIGELWRKLGQAAAIHIQFFQPGQLEDFVGNRSKLQPLKGKRRRVIATAGSDSLLSFFEICHVRCWPVWIETGRSLDEGSGVSTLRTTARISSSKRRGALWNVETR